MNIQQIVLRANGRHMLINKHSNNSRPISSSLQSGPQYMLPSIL